MSTSSALRRVDPHTVDDDPFWGPVRRRHPDVDIVILPMPTDDGPARTDAADAWGEEMASWA